MRYEGSCHCGKIAYEAEGTIDSVYDCNCSLCRRRGGLLWAVPADKFTLKTDAKDLGTYQFNKHVIDHHFCSVCGIAPFSEGKDAKGNAMKMVNVRCLDGVDLGALKVVQFDGAKM